MREVTQAQRQTGNTHNYHVNEGVGRRSVCVRVCMCVCVCAGRGGQPVIKMLCVCCVSYMCADKEKAAAA